MCESLSSSPISKISAILRVLWVGDFGNLTKECRRWEWIDGGNQNICLENSANFATSRGHRTFLFLPIRIQVWLDNAVSFFCQLDFTWNQFRKFLIKPLNWEFGQFHPIALNEKQRDTNYLCFILELLQDIIKFKKSITVALLHWVNHYWLKFLIKF